MLYFDEKSLNNEILLISDWEVIIQNVWFIIAPLVDYYLAIFFEFKIEKIWIVYF